MSAICGLIDLNEDSLPEDMVALMQKSIKGKYYEYKNSWIKNNIFLGCNYQYLVYDSKFDLLPFEDKSSQLIIVADVILDNRDELCRLLDVPNNIKETITDSQLILRAYKAWNYDSPKYLLGDFAFVIFDMEKNEFFCARDHVGKRTLYYYKDNHYFGFCTTMRPLLEIKTCKKKLNDVWIAEFLSFGGSLHEVENDITVYENIKHLLPAHYIRVSKDKFEQIEYWSPLGKDDLILKDEHEYSEALKELLYQSVKDKMRSKINTGIMMSGGIDSGVVGCIASRELYKEGKKLKAYSAVPFAGYKNHLPEILVANESQYIESLKKEMIALDHKYISSENKNSITDCERLINILESPYKTVENLFWIDNIVEEAARDECSIILNGQFGNLTMSFGNIETKLYMLYKQRKFLSIANEIKSYSRIKGLSSSTVWKVFGKKVLPDILLSCLDINRGANKKETFFLPVNKELAAKCNIDERFRNLKFDKYSKKIMDINDVRKTIISPNFFNQIGAVDTKFSLNYGVQARDPTIDKRIVEFCLRVPVEQYVKDGKERYLIRNASKGILPDSIRLNYTHRGLQGADWIQRIIPVMGYVKDDLSKSLKSGILNYYVNRNVIMKTIENIGVLPKNKDIPGIRMLVVCYILNKFLINEY